MKLTIEVFAKNIKKISTTETFYFEQEVIVIGRGGGDFDLNDPGCSRTHAELSERGDTILLIRDLGSRNGTRVNAKRIIEKELTEGDIIQVGSTFIKVVQFVASKDSTGSNVIIRWPDLAYCQPKEKQSAFGFLTQKR